MVSHKAELPDALAGQEIDLQRGRREARVQGFLSLLADLDDLEGGPEVRESLLRRAGRMNLEVSSDQGEVRAVAVPVRLQRVAGGGEGLPGGDPAGEAAAGAVITQAMKLYAAGGRVVSVDADLGTTSGLEAGVAWADQARAFNVGMAESNMACIGEAFAALG